MTTARRKLSMQLTPLLDLLLIVIFAQYMEVRESAGEVEAGAASVQRSLEAAQTESANVRRELAETLTALQAALAREQTDRTLYDRNLTAAVERQQLLGRLMVELFSIPPEVVESLLRPDRPLSEVESSADYQRLREQFRELAAATPGEMVRHLLTFSEVRKQCDIWELHIFNTDNSLRLKVNGEVRAVPLPLSGASDFAALDQAGFEQSLYTLLKSLPQPKGLVFITLTYDFSLRQNVLEPALLGLDRVIDRLRAEAAGRSRFEFADLGISTP